MPVHRLQCAQPPEDGFEISSSERRPSSWLMYYPAARSQAHRPGAQSRSIMVFQPVMATTTPPITPPEAALNWVIQKVRSHRRARGRFSSGADKVSGADRRLQPGSARKRRLDRQGACSCASRMTLENLDLVAHIGQKSPVGQLSPRSTSPSPWPTQFDYAEAGTELFAGARQACAPWWWRPRPSCCRADHRVLFDFDSASALGR